MKVKETINQFGNTDWSIKEVESVDIQYNDEGEVRIWLIGHEGEAKIIQIDKGTIEKKKLKDNAKQYARQRPNC